MPWTAATTACQSQNMRRHSARWVRESMIQGHFLGRLRWSLPCTSSCPEPVCTMARHHDSRVAQSKVMQLNATTRACKHGQFSADQSKRDPHGHGWMSRNWAATEQFAEFCKGVHSGTRAEKEHTWSRLSSARPDPCLELCCDVNVGAAPSASAVRPPRNRYATSISMSILVLDEVYLK